MSGDPQADETNLVTDHRRQWRDCRYVYPVISRRAKGLSIGVNLNIDKRCTFSCVYCQIDRRLRRLAMEVVLPRLAEELDLALTEARTGRLWNDGRFAQTPVSLRRIHDIAFSGDGEPTCLPNFDAAVSVAADVLARHGLTGQVKIVIITNGSHLTDPQVYRSLPILDANAGELWVKLDAGTEAFFRRVNRPAENLALEDICRNLLTVSRDRPVVVQTLFFRGRGQDPPPEEIDAYCGRLGKLLEAGGRIKLIQLHTVARPPACDFVSCLPEETLQRIAETIRQALPNVPVEVYGGAEVPPQNQGS